MLMNNRVFTPGILFNMNLCILSWISIHTLITGN